VIFHAQDVNNYEVIYFRPHSFHSGITPASGSLHTTHTHTLNMRNALRAASKSLAGDGVIDTDMYGAWFS
jgi:hypothetical protein